MPIDFLEAVHFPAPHRGPVALSQKLTATTPFQSYLLVFLKTPFRKLLGFRTMEIRTRIKGDSNVLQAFVGKFDNAWYRMTLISAAIRHWILSIYQIGRKLCLIFYFEKEISFQLFGCNFWFNRVITILTISLLHRCYFIFFLKIFIMQVPYMQSDYAVE